jgi:hypothetical protein
LDTRAIHISIFLEHLLALVICVTHALLITQGETRTIAEYEVMAHLKFLDRVSGENATALLPQTHVLLKEDFVIPFLAAESMKYILKGTVMLMAGKLTGTDYVLLRYPRCYQLLVPVPTRLIYKTWVPETPVVVKSDCDGIL